MPMMTPVHMATFTGNVTDNASECNPSSSSQGTSAFPIGRLGSGSTELLCTHRTYAKYLYLPGQHPSIPEHDDDDYGDDDVQIQG